MGTRQLIIILVTGAGRCLLKTGLMILEQELILLTTAKICYISLMDMGIRFLANYLEILHRILDIK